MAIVVGPSAVVKVVDNVLSARVETVRNDGPDAVTVSLNPAIVAGAGFQIASGAEEQISLQVGQALYAITAATKAASLEVI
jgi:ABC-type molybdate transport system ATPase subunit